VTLTLFNCYFSLAKMSSVSALSPDQPEEAAKPSVKRVPLGMAQKTMAKRMLQSVREIPQFSVSWELDADLLAARRSRINAGIAAAEQRVSVTALLIWLTARALTKHPRMNSRFEDDAAIEPEHVNMAVAMDAPYGLVAPVIRNAETLSVEETAVALFCGCHFYHHESRDVRCHPLHSDREPSAGRDHGRWRS